MSETKSYKVVNGTSYDSRTPKRVTDLLEQARVDRKRVRVFYGHSDSGRDWMEENDVMGTIGRSTGQVKIPLLIRTSRSSGGGAILDQCIVKLAISGVVVWEHPTYNIPTLTVETITEATPDYVSYNAHGFTHRVIADGKISQSAHKSEAKAKAYVEHLTGSKLIPLSGQRARNAGNR